MRYKSAFPDRSDPDEDVETFASDFDDQPVTYEQQNDPQTVVRPDDFPVTENAQRNRHCRTCHDQSGADPYCSAECEAVDGERMGKW